jgi:nucleotide-binding universal stress UspA family protein
MKATRFKKVMIALDYDQSSQKVAEVGYSIGQSLQAEVILLHVISELPVYYSAYTYAHEFKVDMLDDLRASTLKFLNKVKRHLGDEEVKMMIKEGEVAESILSLSKEMDIDVVVMGSHSRKWLEDILMGSEAEDVLKHTQIPLLIIPTNEKLKQ